MDFNFKEIWGLGFIFVGIVWIVKHRIGIGLEGREPSFYIDGIAAIFIGILTVIFGFSII